ncbi:MAG: hypothetical protein ACOYXA_02595 [Bacteroidota bacterium]
MQALIQNIIHQGTNTNFADSYNRRLIYANSIFLTLPIVYLIFVLIDIQAYLKPVGELAWDQFIFLLEIGICIACIYLNKAGYFTVSRLLFILTWPVLMHIVPIWYQHAPSDYYFAYPAGLIFHSLLIQLMFSRRTEGIWLWPLLGLNLLLVFYAIPFLLSAEDAQSPELIAVVNNKYFKLVILLYWLLSSVLIFFIVNAIENLFIDLARANKIIQDQKEEVTAINEELLQSNQTLVKLNEEFQTLNENLEQMVKNRTEELAEKNLRLTDYAFLNAHKLRAPFCRIKGLQQLREVTPVEEHAALEKMIEKELDDLGNIISEIQKIVSE